MRNTGFFLLLLVCGSGGRYAGTAVEARKPSRPYADANSSRRTGSNEASTRKAKASRSVPRRRRYEESNEEEGRPLGVPDSVCEDDVEEDEALRPITRKRRRGSAGGVASSTTPPGNSRGTPPPRQQSHGSRTARVPASRYDDESDYSKHRRSSRSSASWPPPEGVSGRSQSRRVEPHAGGAGHGGTGTFTRGLTALRESMPDTTTVRHAAASTISAARATTKKVSNNLYREVKGLTSSELEQVMLKATRPDDSPAKAKHVERLVGITYQISPRQDIYDPVLRKLWTKMAERDWRTTIKALYVLHRYTADGAPEQAPALKARLRQYRRTRDPKTKDRYFNSKQLLEGDSTPENAPFRSFVERYAHYVLCRAQCFGGMFREISDAPAPAKAPEAQKPVTATSLRAENLEAAQMVLKRGCDCALRDGEECENTAAAVERVASDLIGLTTAVAIALNRVLKGDDGGGADPILIKRWCEFYRDELLPQTKQMVKKTSMKLDAYGLFLPSRMGASVSPELLERGLQVAEGEEEAGSEAVDTEATAREKSVDNAAETGARSEEDTGEQADEEGGNEVDENKEDEPDVLRLRDEDQEEEEEYDEYDYEEEYYDEEEA